MNTHDDSLKPEEFAEAAAAAITDALARSFRDTADVLAASGLFGVYAPEHLGGLGLGLEFAVPISEAAGKLQLHFPLVEQIVLAKAFADAGADASITEALVTGQKIAAIAWRGDPSKKIASHASHANDCDWILVADIEGASLIEANSVSMESNGALDPEHPHYELNFKDAVVKARLSSAAFAALIADAQVLWTGFVNGASGAALQSSAQYTSTRIQFGRPLSAKQVVRHTLARMQLLQTTSTAALHRVLRRDEFSAPRNTATAFSGAVANAIFIIERAIHLHGGMGFTWELPLHYSLREVRKIEAAFDNGHRLEDIGAQFIATS
jgi:alkylation response protein AidB-like acyl-CoA dehydrogenase